MIDNNSPISNDIKTLHQLSENVLCQRLLSQKNLPNSGLSITDNDIEKSLRIVQIKDDKDLHNLFHNIINSNDNKYYIKLLITQNTLEKNKIIPYMLNLLVANGSFDFENNYIIDYPQNLIKILNILPLIDKDIETQFWSILSTVVKKHVRNLQASTEIHLLQYVLRKLRITDGVIADFLIEITGALLSYSVNVTEFKLFLQFFQLQENGLWNQHAKKLIDVLCASIRRSCPENFFAFSGDTKSMISLPPFSKWPTQYGFTFNAWIQMENINNITKYDKDKQYLFNFLTCTKNCGFTAYFLASTFLVLTCMKTNGKGFQHCIKYEFKHGKWYMISIAYVRNRWSKSEIHCYVNGELISRLETNWIVSISETFGNCSIGNSFCGQISATYLFQESLNNQQINAIYKLGPSYGGQFKYENESQNIRRLNEADKKALYDGKLNGSIVFLYDPLACDGQLCLEGSPRNNSNYFVHSPHALMIGDVKAINTHTLTDTMHSLGGISLLFPLFEQIDIKHEIPLPPSTTHIDRGTLLTRAGDIDYTLGGKLIRLIKELAIDSHDVCSQLVQTKGIIMMAYFLNNTSRRHLNETVVDSFANLIEKCEQFAMAKQIMDFIFFNPQLWITAQPKIQARLYTYLATEFIIKTDCYKSARNEIVSQTLSSLKYFYYVVPPYWTSGGENLLYPDRESISLHKSEDSMGEHETKSSLGDNESNKFANWTYVTGSDLYNGSGKSANKVVHNLPRHKTGWDKDTDEITEEIAKNICIYNTLPNEILYLQTIFSPSTQGSELFTMGTSKTDAGDGSLNKYSETNESKCDERPSQIEILNLRAYMVLFLKQILLRDGGIRENEMGHFIDFLATVTEFENIQDVLQLLISLASEHPSSFVPAFDRKLGIRIIFKLLNFEQEIIRAQALKLLGLFMTHSTQKRKDDVMQAHDLFSLLGERIIMLGPQAYTTSIHSILMEILLERMSSYTLMNISPTACFLSASLSPPQIRNFSTKYPDDYPSDRSPKADSFDYSSLNGNSTEEVGRKPPDSPSGRKSSSTPAAAVYKMENPQLLSVIAYVLNIFTRRITYEFEEALCPDDECIKVDEKNGSGKFSREARERLIAHFLDLKLHFINDLTFLCGQSAENRRKILQMSVWQEWLLGLVIVRPISQKEVQISQGVLGLLSSLIHHAIKYEYGGWRVWVDTMAIIHSLVSKEDYRLKYNTPIRSADKHTDDSTVRSQSVAVNGSPSAINSPNINICPKESGGSVPFKIPDFKWSTIHLGLLSDILTRLEKDIDNWKNEAGRNLIDLVNFSENQIFVQNAIHFLSQMMDNFIVSSGGVIQLLAYTTNTSNVTFNPYQPSPMSSYGEERGENYEYANGHRGSGDRSQDQTPLTPSKVMAYLVRFINLIDVFVLASSVSFHEMESEKNIPPGGILRQCLRLACICTVRNCLENQYRKYLQSLLNSPLARYRSNQSPINQIDPTVIDIILGGNVDKNTTGYSLMTPNIQDTEVLLQNIDVTRLKAIIYRDIEETKQSQFLALCVMYFVSVLTVSKYRDLLEPLNNYDNNQHGNFSAHHPPHLNASSRKIPDQTNISNNDNGRLAQHYPWNNSDNTNNAARSHQKPLPHSVTISSENEEEDEEDLESIKEGQIIEMRLQPVALDSPNSLDNELNDNIDNGMEQDMDYGDGEYAGSANYIEKRSTIETNNRASEDATMRGKNVDFDLGTDRIHLPNHESMVDQYENVGHFNQANIVDDNNQYGNRFNEANHFTPREHSHTTSVSEKTDYITKKIERVLSGSAYLLKEVLNDFLPFMTKTFLGTQGHELLKNANGLATLKDNCVIEFIMMLCSQEWQNSLQKHAGSNFLELINEGRILSHAMRDHVIRVSNEADFILNKSRAQQLKTHSLFEELCAQMQLAYHDSNQSTDISSSNSNNKNLKNSKLKCREYASALKILNQITRNRHLLYGTTNVRLGNQNVFLDYDPSFEDSGTRGKKVYWKLDFWEDDCRRRKKLMVNPVGTCHSEAADNAFAYDDNEPPHSSNPTSEPQAEKDDNTKGSAENYKTQTSNDPNLNMNQAAVEKLKLYRAKLTESRDSFDDTISVSDIITPGLEEKDIMEALLVESDVSFTTKCEIVTMGVSVHGNILLSKNMFFFEVDESIHKNQMIDPEILKYLDTNVGGGCVKWNFCDITAIFSRRYLLQNNSLEIFLTSNTSVMFSFPDRNIVKKIVSLLPKVGCGPKYGIPKSRKSSLMSPKQLFKASNMTEKWMQREISNFDYLMFLNTIAGRSYQDLNQYPVFPWILSNYETKELDLNDPINYRDLSKPIGAINNDRRNIFVERYKTWEHNSIPPFHYGTHYSTSAFVLNWLLRIEPFTTLFINLHGGKFDHPNRIFGSIKTAWYNCQRDTSDIKELIPELFYFPEMLCNLNGYPLYPLCQNDHRGPLQNDYKESLHVVKGNVELPPWALNDPNKFVRIHAEALESEIVSCSLNRWIDLIFGYKQRGSSAVEALNVFYYLTYEDNFNLRDMMDIPLKEALENQIKNFGQTPSQLLDSPHHPRQSLMHISPRMFTPIKPDQEITTVKFPFNASIIHVSLSKLDFSSSANSYNSNNQHLLTLINSNFTVAVNKWNHDYKTHLMPPSFAEKETIAQPNLIIVDPFLTQSTGPTSVSSKMAASIQRDVRDHVDPRYKYGPASVIASRDGRHLVLAGFRDKSFRVLNCDNGKVIQTVYSHRDIVTCLAISPFTFVNNFYNSSGYSFSSLSNNFITANSNLPGNNESIANPAFDVAQDFYFATGSRDATVKIWRWYSASNHVMGAMASSVSSRESPFPLVTLIGHESGIVSIALSTELGIVLSLSKNNLCLIHNVNGQIMHAILPPTKKLTMIESSIAPIKNDDYKLTTVVTRKLEEKISKSLYNISQIILSSQGDVITCLDSHIINVFSLNGYLVDTKSFYHAKIKLMDTFSQSFVQEVLVIITHTNKVEFYDLYDDFHPLYSYQTPDDSTLDIKCMTFSLQNKYLIVGMTNGTVCCFLIDHTKWNKKSP
ncbi:unnamed protein product [Gordionus sp. m RMFG-2023]|uniref:neurobeachin-like isoform X2 n=1 Tax=Gordionus sp. m RMFG-2023 TaxID=3053472 RepID=UPI0030E3FCAB